MKNILYILSFSFGIVIGCKNPTDTKQYKPISLSDERLSNDTLNNIGDTLAFDKQFVYDKYSIELNNSLSKNIVPQFIYDECLDANEAAYCDMGSHKSQSLRYNVLQSLTSNQLKQILALGELNELKKVCSLSYAKEKLFGSTSTYDIIKAIQREKDPLVRSLVVL